ncbi:cobalamin-dependent protein [bacterium]|nr:cobalamin-dependent protein [bacterium]
MQRLLPIVRETGANFIALAIDEKGIPADAEDRMKIIRRIIERAEALGIARNRILVDCLVFTVGSQPQQPRETLETVRRVREELGCATILGVSNVSFGLPRRAVISSAFLAMSLQAGLTAGIINPLSDRMMETLRASELLLNRDPGAKNYVKFMNEVQVGQNDAKQRKAPVLKPVKKIATREVSVNLPQEDSKVKKAVLAGDKEGIVILVDELLGSSSPGDILANQLVPAIEEVGRKYSSGEIYLPQLIMAGETMRAAVDHIRPLLSKGSDGALHGTPVVIGTVNGDVHDIGKNIVSIVLENHGFKVIDLGKNVDAQSFVDAVKENYAPVVALSALMTTTMPAMEETVIALHRECVGVKVMVGGAVVTRSFSQRIGADGYAKEAVTAGELARNLAGVY